MHTIAIIGGGLSGTLVAVQLLRAAGAGTRIALIERQPRVGRGVAYATACEDHLLNVPAGRLGVFPERPSGFYDWVAARAGQEGFPQNVSAADFLPRRLFGDYLISVLAAAQQSAGPGVEFEIIAGEALDLEENDAQGRLTLADGRVLDADQVVIALGNLPGEYPIQRPLPFYSGPRYVHIPWRPGVLDNVQPDDDVLLVGAGLTAIDITVQLDRCGHRGVVHALSRRGLRPLAHKPGLPAYPPFLAAEALPTTVRAVFRRVREEVGRARAQGTDWRPVVDAIRAQTGVLWQGFSWAERARFMRHVRPHWEVHRHRIAPQVAATIERIEAEGRVKYYAGRLQSLCETETGATAQFRRRGTTALVDLRVAKVINCTGPRSDYSKFQHPLLVNLLARGLIDHDPLALGIDALPTGEVLRYRAGPVGWLFTLGAPLKGVLWESTAVPEIRSQASALAERLLSKVNSPALTV